MHSCLYRLEKDSYPNVTRIVYKQTAECKHCYKKPNYTPVPIPMGFSKVFPAILHPPMGRSSFCYHPLLPYRLHEQLGRETVNWTRSRSTRMIFDNNSATIMNITKSSLLYCG